MTMRTLFLNTTKVLIILFISSRAYAQNNRYIDSVKTLTNSKIDTIRFWAYSELAWELKEVNKKDAISYSSKLIEQASKTNNQKWYAQGLNDLGITHFSGGELDKALDNFEKSLVIRRKLGSKKDIASSLSKIAVIKTEKAQYGEALKIQLEVLKLYEDLDVKPYISHTCNNIGALYTSINNNKLSNQYLMRAYAIEKEINNKQGLSVTIASMAGNYSDMGNLDSAIICLTEAKILFKELGEYRSYAIACSNLGHTYRKKKNTVKGKENYYEAVDVAREIGDSAGLVVYESNLANILVEEGKFEEAEKMMLNSLNVSKRMGQDESVLKMYGLLTVLYIHMKEPEKGNWFFERYRATKDSVFSKETSKLYSEEQTKFDVAKKDLELLAKSKEIEKDKAQRNLIVSVLLFFILIAGIAIWAFIQKRKSNKQVEQKNKLLEHANIEISHQKEELSEKQKEILDSINYAQRIQNALLANEEFLLNNAIPHFILFKPKDIVSGDFTWATSTSSATDKRLYLACCDSTGHGVPGAFMSLLSMGFLSEAIKERNISEPGKIFDYVRERLIETIGKGDQKDGFDGILLCVNSTNNKITYAGANNNPLLVQNNELIHLPTNKMPVGKGIKTDSFETFEINCNKGDSIYLFTDGYPDQFGGPKGKKFKYKQFEDILLANHKLELNTQKEKLNTAFENWRGNLEQVDDVCVVGIRI